jgi:hypothetical protein
MTELAPECSQCKRLMELGFLLDWGGGGPYPRTWVPGVPESSIWTGRKLKGKAVLPVTTYRCPQCGRLELFARPA